MTIEDDKIRDPEITLGPPVGYQAALLEEQRRNAALHYVSISVSVDNVDAFINAAIAVEKYLRDGTFEVDTA